MGKKVRVDFNPADVDAWMEANPAIKNVFLSAGEAVAAEAQATASDAEEGPGGRIDGYAAAGFTVDWDTSKRPQVKISSNADPETITAVHFHTMKRDGVAHLRAALYSQTFRG
jgi:hypothetical protein